MKILQVSHSFYPCYQAGGVVKVVYDISKALVKRGHHVTVVTTDGCTKRLNVRTNTEVDLEGIHVWYFQNISNYLRIKFKVATPYLLPFIIRKEIRNFDIVHIHEHRTILAVIIYYYAKKYNIPYIVQTHGDILPSDQKENIRNLFDFIWGRKILENASSIIALSDIEKKEYEKLGLASEKIVTILNLINLQNFQVLPKKGVFKKTYGITDKDKIILYVGRIHERKGVDFLLNAYKLLVTEVNNIILVIVGPDDGFLSKINLLVKEYKITDNVIITGQISEHEKIMAYIDADLVVYPAINEIFGLVPFESIMCNTPVIVCDDSGCGNLVRKADCGYLVRYNSVIELKDMIIHILNNNKEAKEKTESGKKFIEENLSSDEIMEKIENVYSDLRNRVYRA